MKNKNTDKYYLELEVIETKEQERPQKMLKMTKKNLRKLILHRINGKVGEC